MSMIEMRFAEIFWTILCHSLWLLPMIGLAMAPRRHSIDPDRADRRMRFAIAACLILPPAVAGFHFAIRGVLTRTSIERTPSVASHPSKVIARTDIANPLLKTIADDTNPPPPEILSWRTIVRSFAPWAVFAWGLGASLMIVRLSGGSVALRLVLDSKPASPDIQAQADRLAACMGLKRAPGVFTSCRTSQPMLIGLIRSRIVAPESWLAEAGEDLREAVLAHELAHARRNDLRNLHLERLVSAVWFFHPAVHRLRKQAALWRELAADKLAIEATGNPVSFALALESVAVWANGQEIVSRYEIAALTFSESRPECDLRRRVEAALNPEGIRSMKMSRKSLLSVTTLTTVLTASAILAIEAAPFDSLAKADGPLTGELTVRYEVPKSEGPKIRFDVRLVQLDEKAATAALGTDVRSIDPNSQTRGFVIEDSVLERLTKVPESSTAIFPKVTCIEGDVVRLRRDSKQPAIVGFEHSKKDRAKYKDLPENARLLDPKLEDTESWTELSLVGSSAVSGYRLKLEGSDRELRYAANRGAAPRMNTVSFRTETEIPEGKSMAYVLGSMLVLTMDNPDKPVAKEYIGRGGIELLGRVVTRIVIVKAHSEP
jgi:hypothetical protein